MPVFNQEKNIRKVLEKICQAAHKSFDLIVINDASTDSSQVQLENFCINAPSEAKKICTLKIVKNAHPLYETASDNIGFKLATTEFIIEIQADIHIEEPGFDAKLISAMEQFQLSAVSGRHIHSFSLLDGPKRWTKYPFRALKEKFSRSSLQAGLVGRRIFSRQIVETGVCYRGETCARGPWLLKKSDLHRYGYLDEKHFFLGNDDHDFHRRMYQETGRVPGYVPLDIYSIEQDGSTRRARSGLNLEIYKWLQRNKNGSDAYQKFLANYRPYFPLERLSLVDPDTI